MKVVVHRSILDIDAAAWDATLDGSNPFVTHRFLAALERSRCIGAGTGWEPFLVTLVDERGLAAAAPGFIKNHSYGEFVFDFSWAQAYARFGLSYYPKLVVGAPFTPATGPRLLVRQGLDYKTTAASLSQSLREAAAESGFSSIHALFPADRDRAQLADDDWLVRRDCQFHWRNHGYRDFDDFLETFTADKRKKVRRERRRVAEAGIEFESLFGDQINAADLAAAWTLHRDTFLRHGHEPYLTLDFFQDAARTLGRDFMITLARRGGETIATAVFFVGSDRLFGRYWGSAGDFHSLHFETCYHQGIEFCIRHGLNHFEPGTQGEHKISRGFEPTLTWSAHHIVDARFRTAIADFVRREARAVDEYAAAVQLHVPYKDRRGVSSDEADACR